MGESTGMKKCHCNAIEMTWDYPSKKKKSCKTVANLIHVHTVHTLNLIHTWYMFFADLLIAVTGERLYPRQPPDVEKAVSRECTVLKIQAYDEI